MHALLLVDATPADLAVGMFRYEHSQVDRTLPPGMYADVQYPTNINR